MQPAELKDLLLQPPALTLAVAESVTSGRVQALAGGISGATAFFRGGLTAYNLEQKVRHLGIDRAAAAAVDCVSASVAEQMACGACRLFGADVGVATTGYAEPAPQVKVARPFAWWGIARRGSDGGFLVSSARVEPEPGLSRVEVQAAIAEAAVAALIQHLRQIRGQGPVV